MSDLPIGWTETSLENVVEILDSRRIPINSQEREKRIVGKKEEKLYPYYGATGQVGYIDDYIFDEPLILLGEDGIPFLDPMRPKAYLVDGKYWVNNHAHVLKSINELSDRHYLWAFLNAYDYREKVTGTTRLKLTQEAMRTIQVSLAPFNEQKRIVNKLAPLLAHVASCQSHLERIPQILKQFHQSVLAAATSGQLTVTWRLSKGYADETTSFDFSDANCFGEYEFPATWQAMRLKDITDVMGGITKDSKKQNSADEELPYLRVANVQRGYFDLSEIKTIRVPKQRVEDLLLKDGDILFNEGGDIDKLGRGWVWSSEIERCIFQNHVFRARLKDDNFVPKFFSHYGNSRGYDYFLRYGKQTTNLASINKTILESNTFAKIR